jgi:predicted NBD/HSP70 family sugar kinase
MRIEHGSTHEAVRRHNLSVVLRQLHVRGAQSRSELAARTELNRSTIKVLTEQLAALGLVTEGGPALRGTRGRPSQTVSVRHDRLAVLAIEIAVDSLAVATIGLGGHIHHRRRASRSPARNEPLAVLEDIHQLVAHVVPESPPITGVGVAVVGVVRRDDGLVHIAPNLGWRDVPLRELIATETVGRLVPAGVPVTVGNEADLGILAENARGAAQGVDDVVYLSGEVGIGGGIVVGGRLLTGATGYAGEIGHLPVNPQGARCGCGGRGCWETEAGKRVLLRLAGVADEADEAGADPVTRVVAAAQSGEARAVRAVDQVGTWLGIGLTGLINVFNPDRIVLGGLYGRAFEVLQPALRAAMKTRALTTSTQPATVVPAALGTDAPLIGAAESALNPLLDEPTQAEAAGADAGPPRDHHQAVSK